MTQQELWITQRKKPYVEKGAEYEVIALSGKFFSDSCKYAGTTIEKILAKYGKNIAFDFSGLEAMSSMGFKYLIRPMTEKGKNVVFLNPNSDIGKLFEISGFNFAVRKETP